MLARYIRNTAVGVTSLVAACLASSAAFAVPGDLDFNGKVEVADARIALFLASGQVPVNSTFLANGDVAPASGKDGRITILDVSRIVRAVNGLDNLGGVIPGGTRALPKSDTVTISGATSRNYTLAGGFLISGTVKDTAGQSITKSDSLTTTATGYITFANASGGGSAYVAEQTGAYSTVVPGGTYTPAISTYFTEFDMDTFEFFSYVMPSPASPSITVSADTTRNYVRPDLPAPLVTSGTVTADNFVAESATLLLTSGLMGSGSSDGTTYSLKSASGSGTLHLSGAYSEDNEGNTSVSVMFPQSVTAGTTRNFTVPTLYPVTGTVTLPGTTALSSVEFVMPPSASNGYSSIYTVLDIEKTYLVAVPPGSYSVEVELAATAPLPQLTYHTTATVTSATGQVKNITVPALPAYVIFSGTVLGPDNKPLAGASVSLNSTALINGFSVNQSAATNGTGQFSALVPAGTYNVEISPPYVP